MDLVWVTQVVAYIGSTLIGAVVGLIAVTIFAVILRGIEKNSPSEAITALKWLIFTVLGGGASDYLVFDVMLKTGGAIVFYLAGLSMVFLSLGFLIFFDWWK